MNEQFEAVIRMMHAENDMLFARIAILYGNEVAANLMMWREEAMSGMRNGIEMYRESVNTLMTDKHIIFTAAMSIEQMDAYHEARHAREATPVKGKAYGKRK